jgi:acetyl esterase/lipase
VLFRYLLTLLAGAVLATIFFLGRDLLDSPPDSVFASREASEAAEAMRRQMAPHAIKLLRGDINDRRAVLNEVYFAPRIAEARQLYPVREEPMQVDGVYTEVFEPQGGVPEVNGGRVLINLHGGAFMFGARTQGRLESIPVASLAGMKVVSVDYRQGPEHRFPAASEDVATVYRHLLREHRPQQIGIFGCSAGGMLTAQAVAWFDAHDLPQPGAVGIFCAGAGGMGAGDAAVISDAFGTNFAGDHKMAYFEDVSWNDPLVSPLEHPELMARFPPTLVITSTRDLAMSSGLATHQRLVAQGVRSELHVYEGLIHYWFADTGLPESRHAFKVMADFFDRHLAN